MGLGKTERISVFAEPGWPKYAEAEHELELGRTTVAFFDDFFFFGFTFFLGPDYVRSFCHVSFMS